MPPWVRRTATAVALLAFTSCSTGGEDGDRGGGAEPTTTAATDGRDPTLLRLRVEADRDEGGRLVDAEGREVLLRGVNVNALADYWEGSTGFDTVFPVAEDDPATMAGLGWNAVRLLLSWSRVEPEPGVYDDGYLEEAAALVERFETAGLYTIIDLHQDAWGPSLAAPPGTSCPAAEQPAFGWDGAPAWATLDGEAARCATAVRELTPAVRAAWEAFFRDDGGPGGVGIQTRYVRMLGHVGGFFAGTDAVAGIDLLNEPNAFGDEQNAALSVLYERAIEAIRAAEEAAGGQPHVVLFEPSVLWASVGGGAPPPFAHDGNVAYAPHLYQGGFDGGPITRAPFETALAEAADLGGVPVLTGEWGTDPARAADPADPYFAEHQRLQDELGFSATLWTWRESCGDPHKAADHRDGRVAQVWGLFEVDCRTNEVRGLRQPLAEALRRGYVRAAPGQLERTTWDDQAEVLVAAGEEGEAGQELVAWLPCAVDEPPTIEESAGLRRAAVAPISGQGCTVTGTAEGGGWSVRVGPG